MVDPLKWLLSVVVMQVIAAIIGLTGIFYTKEKIFPILASAIWGCGSLIGMLLVLIVFGKDILLEYGAKGSLYFMMAISFFFIAYPVVSKLA